MRCRLTITDRDLSCLINLPRCPSVSPQVLDLYSAAPKTSLGLEDKYDVALALLAQALVDAKPPVLNRAADLLGAVATADLDRGRRDTVIVELAVAELLRGAPEASLAWLGFAEAQTSQQRQVLLRAGMDASIREFVRENSPGTDYLTGACTLVERWVNEVRACADAHVRDGWQCPVLGWGRF